MTENECMEKFCGICVGGFATIFILLFFDIIYCGAFFTTLFFMNPIIGFILIFMIISTLYFLNPLNFKITKYD